MDISGELKEALTAVRAAMSSVAADLDKGGNLPHAYQQLQRAEQKLKRTLEAINQR